MCHRLYFSFSSVSFLPHSVVIVLLAGRTSLTSMSLSRWRITRPPSLPSTNASDSWKEYVCTIRMYYAQHTYINTYILYDSYCEY